MKKMATHKETLRDYKKQLAKIEPEYKALVTTIEGLEELVQLEEAKAKTGKQVDFNDVEMPSGAFDNITLRNAALKALFYLNGIPIKSSDLARQLESRGFEHQSKNFANSVNTTLDRLKQDVLVEKMVNGWILTGKGVSECDANFRDESHPYALDLI